MNKDDKNRHFVLLIIDISKHGAKEMGHVKMMSWVLFQKFLRTNKNLSNRNPQPPLFILW